LRTVLTRLNDNGLVINPSKCELGQHALLFLGHEVDNQGIRPNRDAVEAIVNFPRLKYMDGIQHFLGMLNFYHRFLPGVATVLAPLHAISSGKGRDITWTTDCKTVFTMAKTHLANAVMLYHPQPGAKLAMTVDASELRVC